jgi:hypothetical protein
VFTQRAQNNPQNHTTRELPLAYDLLPAIESLHVTVVEHRPHPGPPSSPEEVAQARLTALVATGVMATARASNAWLFGGATSNLARPWLVVTPDNMTLEVIFDSDTPLIDARAVLGRLLADRWNVIISVPALNVPDAISTLGALPLTVRRWDRH